MVDAGILAGDYVIVRQQETAEPGAIVVALLGTEATVKFYQRRGEAIELVPANTSYQPIPVDEGTEFRILGIVKGVIRTVGR